MGEVINFAEKLKRKKEQDTPEQQSGLDVLVNRGEFESLNDSKEFQALSLEGKIVIVRQAISNRIGQVEDIFYEVVRDRPEESIPILGRLAFLRKLKSVAGRTLAEVNKENPNRIENKAA
jgi:hypothetical protein